jgi:serine/threonine-protein kinase haspin
MSSNLTAPAPDIAYLDLSADPALFEGEGDIDYQYDVYRHMRGEVLFSDCTITTPWKSPPPARKKPAGPRGKTVKPMENVDSAAMLDDMTLTEPWQAYKPATNLIWLHFVLTKLIEVVLPPMSEASEDCEEWMPQQELAGQLYYRLMMLGEEKLTLESIKAGTWESVAEMVEWAVKQGWIGEEDVVGEGR